MSDKPKKGMAITLGVFLTAAIAITILVIYIERNRFNITAIKNISSANIKSIKIVPPKAGFSNKGDLAFHINDKQQMDKVNELIDSLKSGTIVGYAKDEFISDGGSPSYLVIELQNGTTIEVKSALGSSTTKMSNGFRVDAQDIPGQVTIYVNNARKPVRELSPELKYFIQYGWKDFFESGR